MNRILPGQVFACPGSFLRMRTIPCNERGEGNAESKIIHGVDFSGCPILADNRYDRQYPISLVLA